MNPYFCPIGNSRYQFKAISGAVVQLSAHCLLCGAHSPLGGYCAQGHWKEEAAMH